MSTPGKSRTKSGRFKKGKSGNPEGRPKGLLNKATVDMKKLSQDLTTANPKWVSATKKRLEDGNEPAQIVVTLLHYAHGKPVERVEVSNPDGTSLFAEMPDPRLAKLAAEAAAVLRRSSKNAE